MPRGGARKGAGRPPTLDRETVSLTVQIYPEQRAALDSAASECGVSVSEVVRRLLPTTATQARHTSTDDAPAD